MATTDSLARVQAGHRAAGAPPCGHQRTDPEYFLNTHTGDRACLDCGDWLSPTGTVRTPVPREP